VKGIATSKRSNDSLYIEGDIEAMQKRQKHQGHLKSLVEEKVETFRRQKRKSSRRGSYVHIALTSYEQSKVAQQQASGVSRLCTKHIVGLSNATQRRAREAVGRNDGISYATAKEIMQLETCKQNNQRANIVTLTINEDE
jgi:hypothetical protein